MGALLTDTVPPYRRDFIARSSAKLGCSAALMPLRSVDSRFLHLAHKKSPLHEKCRSEIERERRTSPRLEPRFLSAVSRTFGVSWHEWASFPRDLDMEWEPTKYTEGRRARFTADISRG